MKNCSADDRTGDIAYSERVQILSNKYIPEFDCKGRKKRREKRKEKKDFPVDLNSLSLLPLRLKANGSPTKVNGSWKNDSCSGLNIKVK